MDGIANKIEVVAERIKLLRKKLLNSKRKKSTLLAELVKLSKVEDDLKIKLDKELARKNVLLNKQTEKRMDVNSSVLKYKSVASLTNEDIFVPLDTVERYSYPNINRTLDDDPNIVPVKLEEVQFVETQDEEELVENPDVLHESFTLDEYPDDFDDPFDSPCANQSMDVDDSKVVGATAAAASASSATITSPVKLSTEQDEGSRSNAANDVSLVLRKVKKIPSRMILHSFIHSFIQTL